MMQDGLFAFNFFGDPSVPGHDRYLIYRMLGRCVSFINPFRTPSENVGGAVQGVYRDIFDGEIELTLDGQLFRFKEPGAIVNDGSDIVFLYGNMGMPEDEDLEVGEEAGDVDWKKVVDDATEVRFKVSEPIRKRRRWTRRTVQV